MSKHRMPPQRRAPRALAAAALLLTLLAVATGSAVAAGSSGGFSTTKTLQRTNVDGTGQSVAVASYHFAMSVDKTRNLRNRQEISVSWSGAHPTGGIPTDETSSNGAYEEYPVVVMMCRGTPSTVTPKSCWTATPLERSQSDVNFDFPPYRVDQYASAADRGAHVGVPSPLPAACSTFGAGNGVQHWVPFVDAAGHAFGIGPNGCAGLPPEATIIDGAQPSNTVYADTHLNGKGRTNFVITTDETNASLGCSDKVACSLVVVPIVGISCDPYAFGLPAADQPPTPLAVQRAADDCEATGNYPPGSQAPASPNNALSVSGALWWSASNWRGHVAVPLSFAAPDDVCGLVSSAAPEAIYGSPLLTQAAIQWEPYFCTRRGSFNLKHVITSEPEAKNLLQNGVINAAFQGGPPESPFSRPVVQAPTAFTGFAVVFKIDDGNGLQVFHLNLNARLLAKLLSESYPGNTSLRAEYPDLQNNPVNLAIDPEFHALNPAIPSGVHVSEAASTIMTLSADSDTTHALTSYINADSEARAWLNGKPDPWGMVVNPAYKGIALPVDSFPLLDHYSPQAFYANNVCLRPSDPEQPSLPYLPLIAAPVQSQALITLDMQYDISNSQIQCEPTPPVHLKALGREAPGTRFLLGITSLADAQRYALPTAELQTSATPAVTGGSKFTDASGRTFVGPTTAGLLAAAKSLTWSTTAKTWVLPYRTLPKTTTGRAAYPGSVLLSTDVPTTGLSRSTAKDLGAFLTFVSGVGQRPGFDTGEVPPGFLPLTAANGFATQLAYTKSAAIAVTAQSGQTPNSRGALPRTVTTGGGTPAGYPVVSGSGGTSTSGPPGGPVIGPTGSQPPTVKNNGRPSTVPLTIAKTGYTAAVSPASWGNALLPLAGVLCLAGLVAGLGAALRWQSR